MSYTPHATIAELIPTIQKFAETCGVRAPSRKTIINWASRRDLSKFPEPIGKCHRGTTRRDAFTYDVNAVLTWYLERLDRQISTGRLR